MTLLGLLGAAGAVIAVGLAVTAAHRLIDLHAELRHLDAGASSISDIAHIGGVFAPAVAAAGDPGNGAATRAHPGSYAHAGLT